MKLISRPDLDLFGSDNAIDLHWGKLFIHMFQKYFSKYEINLEIDSEGFIDKMITVWSVTPEQIIRIDKSVMNDPKTIHYGRSEVLLILKEGLFVSVCDDTTILMYSQDIPFRELEEIMDLAVGFKTEKTEMLRKFFMVTAYNRGLDLMPFDIKNFEMDIRSHYNDDFEPIHELITASLNNKEKNGLILLYGKYGSGKTHYLRYLMSCIERTFIYFPLDMLHHISSPQFLPFIAEHSNSVLVLEDCEGLLASRESAHGNMNPGALSNLLNIGDGLLADALKINVICTFNSNLKKIDDALLRKGRLIAMYEFKELEHKKAQDLALRLGKNIEVVKPMTVADIYNCSEPHFENSRPKAIGFTDAA